MKPGFSLEEAVRAARSGTGVPGVAAGLSKAGAMSFAAEGVVALGGSDAVIADTPFRIASITKPFTSTLCAEAGVLDDRARALLSHTAGLRCESVTALPEQCRGLWSYSNTGYWAAAALAAGACAASFEEAMRTRVLEPFGLAATGLDEPADCARGHVQERGSGHRAVLEDAYSVARRPSGGLWSTAADLLRFGERHLGSYAALQEPQAEALGARYALGWWVRDLAGRTAVEHEGSVAGYQSLLLLVPDEELVLAVLTNSWRGSGLIRRVIEALGLARRATGGGQVPEGVTGTYALDGAEAVVEASGDGLSVTSSETDPVTGTRTEVRFPARALGGRVFGTAGGLLQSHRLDFPRAGVARVGWVALPRVSS